MGAKVSFNELTKIITVTLAPDAGGEVFLDVKADLYSDGKEDWVANENLRRFAFPIVSVGGNPLPGEKALGATFFLASDWKIRPYEASHRLTINGNLYSADGTDPFLDTIGTFTVRIMQQVSSLVDSTVQQLAEIEYASFGDMVTIDPDGPYSASNPPMDGSILGTPRSPVNNITDAYDIAVDRGFITFYIKGDLHITDAIPDLNGFTLIGVGMDRTFLEIEPNATVTDCAYRDATVTGTLDGNSRLVSCQIDDLIYVKGFIEQCVLAPGTITLAGSEEAHFLDCWSGVPGTDTPTIDMGGSGQALALRNYNGGIKLINKNGNDSVSIDLNSGQIILESSITAGDIVCRGIGKLTDNSVGANVLAEDLLNAHSIEKHVWDSELADHLAVGTYGHEIATKADVKSSASSKYFTAVSTALVSGSTISGSDADIDVRDGTLWQIQEDAVDGLTVEFTFNIADDDKAGQFAIFGRYEGVPSTTHYMDLWVYNYESAAWELLIDQFLPGGNTSDDEYMHEYFERNIDRSNSNEVKIRLVHAVTTYNASHNLYLDAVAVSSIEVITAAGISDAVWSSNSGLQVLTDLSFIAGIEGGRWILSGNQMIFYLDDNVTEIARFDVSYDANQNPIERVRA